MIIIFEKDTIPTDLLTQAIFESASIVIEINLDSWRYIGHQALDEENLGYWRPISELPSSVKEQVENYFRKRDGVIDDSHTEID